MSTPSTGSNANTVDSLKKLEETPEGQRQRWQAEVIAAEKELDRWHQSANKVVRRYLDERDAVETSQKWFNLFWTNTGIMESSLYTNIPTVDVSRKFFQMDDDVARVAGIMLQRAIQQDMAEPECDFDQVMRHSVSDRLIPGLGTAWVRLETETENAPALEDGTTPLDDEGNPLQQIAHQEICIDYVYWEDFLWSPCRVWADRRWVARKVPMTRDACIERWGEEVGKRIPMDYKSSSRDAWGQRNEPGNVIMKRACIYEIWDLESRDVIWFSKGYEKGILEKRHDPLQMQDRFEPCPKPLFANLTTSNCVPKADYAMIQDQYDELDETNNRISLLIIACKCTGVYDRSADGVQRMLTEGSDNTLIPVDNWAMFAEKGGIKGQVDWLPLDVVVQALGQLQAHREAIKGQIYELTGISDIVRGASKASETLGAQELKAKFVGIRIQKLQDEVTRFAEEILQIKGEIIVKHFAPQIIAKMANVENMTPEDQQFVLPALQLLKSGQGMDWRITIQADAMAMIDYNQQKTERTEFLNAVATFLQSSSTVGQGAPELIPLMLQMLKFGVAGFRISKDLEGVFDRYIKEFEQGIEQQKQQPPPPDPEQVKAEAEAKAREQDAMLKRQAQQADLAAEAHRLQMEHQAREQEMQQDQMRFMMEMRQSMAEFAQSMQQMREEFALKMRMDEAKAEQQAAIARAKAEAQSETSNE
jgi:hypothetical protein